MNDTRASDFLRPETPPIPGLKLRPLSNGDLVPLPCTLALPKK